MEDEFEIVSFRREQMQDFYDFILPDIYSELLGIESFDNDGVIAIGALRDGVPCGAAICSFAGEATYSLISIIMDEAERRQGGGLMMLNAAVNEALRLIDWQGDDFSIKKLELKADYAMREDDIEGMDKFLSAFGFRDFTEASPIFILNDADIDQDLIQLIPFTELYDDGIALYAALENTDLSPEPELSFYIGDPQDTPMVFITNPAGDHSYFISSRIFGDIGRSDYEKAFHTFLKKIKEADAEAKIFASADMNPYSDILEKSARENGTVCIRRQASCYILLHAEENK